MQRKAQENLEVTEKLRKFADKTKNKDYENTTKFGFPRPVCHHHRRAAD